MKRYFYLFWLLLPFLYLSTLSCGEKKIKIVDKPELVQKFCINNDKSKLFNTLEEAKESFEYTKGYEYALNTDGPYHLTPKKQGPPVKKLYETLSELQLDALRNSVTIEPVYIDAEKMSGYLGDTPVSLSEGEKEKMHYFEALANGKDAYPENSLVNFGHRDIIRKFLEIPEDDAEKKLDGEYCIPENIIMKLKEIVPPVTGSQHYHEMNFIKQLIGSKKDWDDLIDSLRIYSRMQLFAKLAQESNFTDKWTVLSAAITKDWSYAYIEGEEIQAFLKKINEGATEIKDPKNWNIIHDFINRKRKPSSSYTDAVKLYRLVVWKDGVRTVPTFQGFKRKAEVGNAYFYYTSKRQALEWYCINIAPNIYNKLDMPGVKAYGNNYDSLAMAEDELIRGFYVKEKRKQPNA